MVPKPDQSISRMQHIDRLCFCRPPISSIVEPQHQRSNEGLSTCVLVTRGFVSCEYLGSEPSDKRPMQCGTNFNC
jgi:hypothetical protein